MNYEFTYKNLEGLTEIVKKGLISLTIGEESNRMNGIEKRNSFIKPKILKVWKINVKILIMSLEIMLLTVG